MSDRLYKVYQGTLLIQSYGLQFPLVIGPVFCPFFFSLI